jgi:hypothetical protein
MPINDEKRAWLVYAGEIKELIALSKWLFAGTLSRALLNGDIVADLAHHRSSPRRVFVGRKDIGKDRLRL